MLAKIFPAERLNIVRDIFIFSCYTGLAYATFQKLKRAEIIIGIDGNKWISTTRQKTETFSRILLLPIALEYKNHPRCLNEDLLLPVLSNQNMNGYLKEIGAIGSNRKEIHVSLCASHICHYGHVDQWRPY